DHLPSAVVGSGVRPARVVADVEAPGAIEQGGGGAQRRRIGTTAARQVGDHDDQGQQRRRGDADEQLALRRIDWRHGRRRRSRCLGEGWQVHLPGPGQRIPRYESATTHAAAVSTQVAYVSPQLKALIWPAATMGSQISSRNKPIIKAERLAASRASTLERIAAPAAR